MSFWELLEILAIAVEYTLISLIKMISWCLQFMENVVSVDCAVDVLVVLVTKLYLIFLIQRAKRWERFKMFGLVARKNAVRLPITL